jgi:putative ABC transport system substrate-binding protein
MKRREFITLIGGAVFAGATTARADTAMPLVGYLSYTSAELETAALLPAFRQGLRDSGFVEGENVGLSVRSAGANGGRPSPSFSGCDCRPWWHATGARC